MNIDENTEYQEGYAAGMEAAAKRILELEAAIKAANEALRAGEGVGLCYYLEFDPQDQDDDKHIKVLQEVLEERSP